MIPNTCEVLVVGAGPAGAAAAHALGVRGRDVLLVDQRLFPRDKVCGDALIPDALHALDMLGIAAEVRSLARPLLGIDIYAPDGSKVRVAGDVACVRRRTLDDALRIAAVRAGARFFAPFTFANLSQANDRIAVNLVPSGGCQVCITARFVVIATGANAASLETAGVCSRKAPSAIAVRAYYRNKALSDSLDTLSISFEQHVLPGYGWVFPEAEGILNVGAIVFLDGGRSAAIANVRDVFRSFIASSDLGRWATQDSAQLTPLKGAPIRTNLSGSALGIPGVLVAGEAAGTTYSLTGEGIGKALETGLIAAETIEAFFCGHTGYGRVHEQYRRTLDARLRSRYRSYKAAQWWFRYPRLGNWVAEQARKRPYVLRRLEAVLAESEHPTALFSLAGLARALVAR